MKKMLYSLLLVGVLFLSCKAPSTKIRIGVSSANFNDTFLNEVVKSMHTKAEMMNVELIVQNASEDVSKQKEHVENFITRNIKAIIVIPVDTAAMDPIIDLTNESNTILVFVNRRPETKDENKVWFYVGNDEKKGGVDQMEYLAKRKNYKGNVAIIMGILGNEGARERSKGVEEVVSKYPDMKVIAKQTANWQRSEAVDLMENWLTSGKDIDLIASNNDDMALGAAAVVERNGLKGKILIAGIDGTTYGLEGIANEDLIVTMFQSAGKQGGGSVEVAVQALNKEIELGQDFVYPFDIIDKSNYVQFQ